MSWNANSGRIDVRLIGSMATFLLCLLLAGCHPTGWYEVKPHYDAAHPPARFEFRNLTPYLSGVWGSRDGSQLWAVGIDGSILHYTTPMAEYRYASSSTHAS